VYAFYLQGLFLLRKDAAPALPAPNQWTMTDYDDYGVPVGAYEHSESESLTHQAWRVARAFVVYKVQPRVRAASGKWSWRRVLSVGNLLVAVWCLTLYWGERTVFRESVDACRWEGWEKWVWWSERARLVCRELTGAEKQCESASTRLRRRPAVGRPAYLPWPAVASQYARS
jgi:hypothetical protein